MVYLGQDVLFYPLGVTMSQDTAKGSAGGRGGGCGCSWVLGEACGACAEDAALGGSMLIPLSVLQSRVPAGPARWAGRARAAGERE